jgi:4-hydroxy-tetrahydrodipicolinate synthase
MRIHGAFAALATPVDSTGQANDKNFERLVDFLIERGVDGLVIGGATGEYVHFDANERARLAKLAIARASGRVKMMTCVGTSSIHSTMELARAAEHDGNTALLLPMPYFFRYNQDDLTAFVEHVSGAIDKPFLLYNLPGFTNPLNAATALELMRAVPNVIGMKDSSGERDHLDFLAQARQKPDEYSILVGDDSLLLSAAKAGWDGVISGIACFAPELITATFRSHRDGAFDKAEEYQAMLDEIIGWVGQLPIPWAVRAGLAVRGIDPGPMHLPLSPARAKVVADFTAWFRQWLDEKGWPAEGVWELEHCVK